MNDLIGWDSTSIPSLHSQKKKNSARKKILALENSQKKIKKISEVRSTAKKVQELQNPAHSTINVFNNITTGVVNFCYGLTSSGTLQIGPCRFKHGPTNFYGYSRFLLNSTTASIIVPIDIDYYVVCSGLTATNLTLPTYITNQFISIRNSKLANVNVTILPISTQFITSNNGAVVTTYTLARNATVNLFSNGSMWYVM